MSGKVVNCDNCKEDFEIEIKEKLAGKDITKVYFECPHCGEEYTVHYTSKEIIDKQKVVRDLINRIGKARKAGNLTKAERLYQKYLKLREDLEGDMNKLKDIMNS